MNRNNLKDKKPSKGHTPQKGKQQTLTDFFKQNNSDTQTGKKRFTNSVRTFSKVIVIDEDCESNSGVKSNNKDKVIYQPLLFYHIWACGSQVVLNDLKHITCWILRFFFGFMGIPWISIAKYLKIHSLWFLLHFPSYFLEE